MEGVNKYFMLVPNSVKVLEDKLPKCPYSRSTHVYGLYKRGLHDSVEFVDVYDMLYSKRQYIYKDGSSTGLLRGRIWI